MVPGKCFNGYFTFFVTAVAAVKGKEKWFTCTPGSLQEFFLFTARNFLLLQESMANPKVASKIPGHHSCHPWQQKLHPLLEKTELFMWKGMIFHNTLTGERAKTKRQIESGNNTESFLRNETES